MLPRRIILIGPSGSGKSAVAERLGRLVGYQTIDIDDRIVGRIGMPIAAFFDRFGEPAFRAIESEELNRACSQATAVIATGGGIVLSETNWAVMRPESVIVGLLASSDVLLQRVRDQMAAAGEAAARPLLSGNAEERLRQILSVRGPLYARADLSIRTDAIDVEAVAAHVLEACTSRFERQLIPRLSLNSVGGRSDIYVAAGSRLSAATLVRERWPNARRAWLISDETVDARWGQEIADVFSEGGIGVARLTIPPGEQSKAFSEVERLCCLMTERGVTRRDVVVALGGGVVGDLAGFVAGVCLRGLPLVQIPTSLLAMVDSSVGGKTGVNLPAGKNLAGAFYQPGIVAVDPRYLPTLSTQEYRSGMAEVIKHSVIQPSTPLGGTSLAELLESAPLGPIPDDIIERVLALNVAIKHSVVQRDERESGMRMILNFGHTAGHAIEADGYRYRHGEAVAIGMVVAFQIAQLLGRVSEADMQRLTFLLAKACLPATFEGDVESVISRLSRDKKHVDGSLHWVLPRVEGGVEIVTGVDREVVRQAICAVRDGA